MVARNVEHPAIVLLRVKHVSLPRTFCQMSALKKVKVARMISHLQVKPGNACLCLQAGTGHFLSGRLVRNVPSYLCEVET